MGDYRSPILIAMCGIPFAGKSTLAQEIVARCGFTLVSVDEIVRGLAIDLGTHADNQRGWARAMAEGFERARQAIARGELVIYDNANHTRRNRDRCRRIASQGGAGFRCIWVDVPVETARERLLANRDDPRRVDVPDASFWQIVNEFEPPIEEPDVVRYQPGTVLAELVRELEIASSKVRHPERSEG